LNETPNYNFGHEISEDKKYLIITIHDGCDVKNKLYYADLTKFDGTKESLTFVKFIDTFEANYGYITNDENLFYF
jgi:prolyl oligopeptidase